MNINGRDYWYTAFENRHGVATKEVISFPTHHEVKQQFTRSTSTRKLIMSLFPVVYPPLSTE